MSSIPPRDCLALNGATSRLDRRLAALGEGYAKVDGRSFEELCAFAPRFGELIWFYGLDDGIDGDWSELFAADPTIALAAIRGIDLVTLEASYRDAASRAATARDVERQLAGLRTAGGVLVDVARQVDRWLAVLSRGGLGGGSRPLRERLEQLIDEEVGEPLATLAAYDSGAAARNALGERLGLDLTGFLPIWRLDDVPPDRTPYWGRTRGEKIAHAAQRFAPLADALIGGVEELRRFAAKEWPRRLEAADHRPQAALYLAFARLFRGAQDTINTFGRRYIDFYYREVLREQPRGALPDRLYLTYALADDEDLECCPVAGGTLFTTGQSAEDEAILYRTERDLVVTRARLERLRTLRLLHDSTGAPRRLLASEIRLAEADGGPGEPPACLRSWPSFGRDPRDTGRGEGSVVSTWPATLGLALSSTCLHLESGRREIRLYIGYHLSMPVRGWRRLLTEAFELSLTTAGGWLAVAYSVEKLTSDRFEIHLELPTGAPPIVSLPATDDGDGQEDSEGPTIPDVDPGVPALALRLRQGPISVGDDPHRPDVDPLPVLSGLRITSCELEVEVEALQNLRVENTDGEVDTSGPFPLFGGLPRVGSRLRLYHDELFIKRLGSLEVGLCWFGLPQDEHGFRGYYQSYVRGPDNKPLEPRIDNLSFEGDFQLIEPGLWDLPKRPPPPEAGESSGVPPLSTPSAPPPRPSDLRRPSFAEGTSSLAPATWSPTGDEPRGAPLPFDSAASGGGQAGTDAVSETGPGHPEDPRQVYLFRTPSDWLPEIPDPEGALCSDSTFFFPCRKPKKKPDFYDPSRSAIELALGAPPCAFGNDIYSQNVLAAVLEELALVEACRRQCERQCATSKDPGCLENCIERCTAAAKPRFPNEPWLPQVKEIKVSYSADTTNDCEDNRIRASYLLPFGGFRGVDRADDRSFPLLPPIDAEGQLLLGFRGLGTRQKLTLLFAMAPRVVTAESVDVPQVSWWYRDSRKPAAGWENLGEQVLSDSTHGLTRTGIVELALPAFPPSGTLVEPPDLYWLRASVAASADAIPDTCFVMPQASTAVAVLAESTDPARFAQPLPAHTITAAVADLPGIGGIDQPLASFGGRPSETGQRFETRLGERLRHKDRAIQPWDYERLVLERFPVVWKVGVLPARNASGHPAPGEVTIVVVPGPDAGQGVDPIVPAASSDLLAKIRDYLMERTGPFVCCHVVNPRYLRIRVEARVAFRQEDAGGAGIEQLNDTLVRWLSPWFYDAERAALGGDYVNEPAITELIVTQPYVVWLESLRLSCETPDDAREPVSGGCFFTSAESHDIEETSQIDPCAIGPHFAGRRAKGDPR